ncbi:MULTISPECIES: hypothetical protein [Parapedobacter]|uniref:Uncharacterized protein n=1 Tax=Parapedobacter indicus TaxID=1477437 RepID=A0A1I3DTZ6_9SPHI|nr:MULTISPECIES: hypothetical protein [Parapedobacter]MEC3879111.1 hypothetical protein [Parapedobacter sp. 10938]PPL04843.1 hypothetical protein CLV26_101651 [Parapedobacter indicus]SFH90204.1 hypothetical protein SAMN05444682_101637 [Parapedobacter indicus]
MDYHLRSLQQKLSILASGEDIGITPQEAAIYGVEYADEWPEDESPEVDEYEQ